MSVDQVTTLLALLALGAGLVALAIAVVAILASRSATWSERLAEFRARYGTTALLAAAIIGFAAIGGSLYLSEVAHFEPCRLCWYQRIAAYPLGPLLLLAFIRRDHGIRPYIWLMTGIGILISTYHVLVERFPSLETGACEVNNPCFVKWVEKFGFVTIPTMAWLMFASIGSVVWLAGRQPVDEMLETEGSY
jgi:disulfide bond formation protein DsbB